MCRKERVLESHPQLPASTKLWTGNS